MGGTQDPIHALPLTRLAVSENENPVSRPLAVLGLDTYHKDRVHTPPS